MRSMNAKVIFEMLKMTDKCVFFDKKLAHMHFVVPLRKISDKLMRIFSMRTFSHSAKIAHYQSGTEQMLCVRLFLISHFNTSKNAFAAKPLYFNAH